MIATQATLGQDKLVLDGVLTQIDYVEYTFLQIFHSLSAGDVSFANQLLELYSNHDSLRLSDYFKSHVVFLPEPTYCALDSVINLSKNGLKPIPEEIIKGILLVANKSSVFNEASKRGNLGVIKWLQNYVSEAERCTALETAWQQNRLDIAKMFIKSNITLVKPGMSWISRRNKNQESILHLAVESKNPFFVARLIECDSDVNASDANGITPLLIAVRDDDIVTAKLLIEKQADVNAATRVGTTALHEAARNGNHEMVLLLLSSGSSANRETDQGLTPSLISEKYAFINAVEYLFWNNAITVKRLRETSRYLYIMTSYEAANRPTRRRKISVEQILMHSMIVKELILRGENTSIPVFMKSTLLYLVMELGLTTLAKSMFNIGAKLDIERYDNKLIFREAIIKDNHELIALLMSEGRLDSTTVISGYNALELAADYGSVATFNLLLNKGANTKLHNKESPIIHTASAGGNEAIVRYLLKNGFKVDTPDSSMITPLFHAAIFGHSNIVKILIDNKANPNARNNANETPLHYATYGEDPKSLNILIEKGAEIEARNYLGETPLFVAAKEGKEASLAILLEAGATPGAKDIKNQTPLEISIQNRNINTTRLLIDYGMSPNIINAQSKTSLHLAVSSGSEEMVELLLKQGVLINAPDSDLRNALHEAVAKKSLSIVKLLVDSGILINAKDKDGKTPLDYAIIDCSRNIVSYLIKKGAKSSIHVNTDPKCNFGD